MILVSKLKKILDDSLGKGEWKDFEVETLILESGIPYSDLLFDKVALLRVIEHYPTLFFEDVMFMAYAADVFNHSEADFDVMPHITSLEMALAINEMALLLSVPIHELPTFDVGTTMFIKHILTEEGYSKVLSPFDIVGITGLSEGQTEQDTADKEMAIKGYLYAIYNK